MIDAKTTLLGIVGDPVEHSLSPQLHNYLFKRLNVNGRYLAFRVKPDALSRAVAGLDALGATGFNVTVPHKQAIIPLLDSLSPEAQALGAVNTVVRERGRLVGHNTDWIGFLEPLSANDVHIEAQHAVVLGAGGAALGVVYGLIRAHVGHISVVNRTLHKAQALAQHVRQRLNFKQVETLALDDNALGTVLRTATLLVNATSVGLWPHSDKIPISRDLLLPQLTVYDLVYNPLETQLLKAARAVGADTLDGLGMLIGQAVAAFSLWTGVDVPSDEVAKLRERLSS